MSRPNEKEKVVRHYDFLSPYYLSLWGEHLHHGYWVRGDESREEAQVQLIAHLAKRAEVQTGARVLDIGCGLGGSSFFLAKHLDASATGITISPVQCEMAQKAAARRGLDARFLLMDAEGMQFQQPFDVFWSIESVSHYSDPARFFASAVRFLKPGGTFALTDSFRKKGLTAAGRKKYIEPIENLLLVELREMDEYAEYLASSGLRVTELEVLNAHCRRTWHIPLDVMKNRSFWELAAMHGREFLSYLRAFRAMRAGFSSGSFVYGLIVAKLPRNGDYG